DGACERARVHVDVGRFGKTRRDAGHDQAAVVRLRRDVAGDEGDLPAAGEGSAGGQALLEELHAVGSLSVAAEVVVGDQRNGAVGGGGDVHDRAVPAVSSADGAR